MCALSLLINPFSSATVLLKYINRYFWYLYILNINLIKREKFLKNKPCSYSTNKFSKPHTLKLILYLTNHF